MSGATSQQPSSRRRRGRAAPAESRRPWRIIAAMAAVGVLGAVLATLVLRPARAPDVAVPEVIDGVVTLPSLAPEHLAAPVAYEQIPPAGGTHSPAWQNCGMYSKPVIDELAVHSLEHGAVWLAYRPDLAADQVEQLRRLARGRPYVLLAPHERITSPVVATAWGLQLAVDDPADVRLAQFVAKYQQGPQTPEPGATCTGGNGVPDVR
ncbi:MAG TPA: DUF3105 domain-containing protein [Chloroflexaceae bacterium]|nr:DUF3105 domain-containing protein [Chloroflexaceae bacterium]